MHLTKTVAVELHCHATALIDRVGHNRAVEPKMSRGLKFWSKEVEGLYYLCSESKGADHLRGYLTADLHLCFRISKTCEPCHEKTNILHMRKQRRRSALRLPRS